ncbi:MAG: TetR/AcrR family transcriptional regulator [Nitrospirae bacterium]|nr:MAG: TetR/AcrR family transcriptional regulator [Nitrospirota bacterium]
MTMNNTSKVSTDVRRAQIVDATLRLIAAKGVSALTTARIAREVGISEANIYRHFTSKAEILAVTVERIGEGMKRNIENVLKMCISDSPLEQLKRAFMLHLDYIEKNEGIPRLVYSEEIHVNNEILKDKLLCSINEYAVSLDAIIKNGQQIGQIKKEINSREAALTLIGMIQVTVLRWSLSGFSFSLVTEGLKLWENYKKCIETG